MIGGGGGGTQRVFSGSRENKTKDRRRQRKHIPLNPQLRPLHEDARYNVKERLLDGLQVRFAALYVEVLCVLSVCTSEGEQRRSVVKVQGWTDVMAELRSVNSPLEHT
jgi:hypothetical protein